MSRHLIALRGGRVDDPTIDPAYWQHPVHAKKVTPLNAAQRAERDRVMTAHFTDLEGDEHPTMARIAASVLYAELGKPKSRTDWAKCYDVLQDLGAYLSKPAGDDSCNPHGIERPTQRVVVTGSLFDDGGVA